MLEVRATDTTGRGVFATRPIAAGEVLEVAPVIVLPAADRAHVMHTRLYEYLFRWGHDQVAVCLGFGSIYNHSRHPNARYVRHFDSETIHFVALRAISRDEEICTNYNANERDRSELWFEDKS
jgi:SET domain-containing protein